MLTKKTLRTFKTLIHDVKQVSDQFTTKTALDEKIITHTVKGAQKAVNDANDDVLDNIQSRAFRQNFAHVRYSLDKHMYVNVNDQKHQSLCTAWEARLYVEDLLIDGENLYQKRYEKDLAMSTDDVLSARGRRNRYAFYVGNLHGLLKEQVKAEKTLPERLHHYLEAGDVLIRRDERIIGYMENNEYQATMPPCYLLNNDHKAIVHDIKLGRRVLSNARQRARRHKKTARKENAHEN